MEFASNEVEISNSLSPIIVNVHGDLINNINNPEPNTEVYCYKFSKKYISKNCGTI